MKYWSFDNSEALRQYREQRRLTWVLDSKGGNMNKNPDFWKALWQALKDMRKK